MSELAGKVALACEMGLRDRHRLQSNALGTTDIDTARIDMLRVDGRFEKCMKDNPLGYVGKPKEIAERVRFLYGPNVRWISGGEVRCGENLNNH